MNTYNCNLNISYNVSDKTWEKINNLYEKMPNWSGKMNGIPTWYGQEEEKIIECSVEPSGLQFYAVLPEEEWEWWITKFKNQASDLLGYKIGEPEEGFDFPENGYQ